MDEFKREYSNKDTLEVALPYFWKNFEKDNYSIWYCEYKYNSELTKIFMTCNLIGGKRNLNFLLKTSYICKILKKWAVELERDQV